MRKEKGQEETPLDEETLKHLSSLGYVTGSSVEEDFSFDQSKADPKDLIGYHNESRKISQLVHQEKFAEAWASDRTFSQATPCIMGYTSWPHTSPYNRKTTEPPFVMEKKPLSWKKAVVSNFMWYSISIWP